MKRAAWFYVICCSTFSCQQKEKPVSVDLPVTLVTDYGPFYPGFSALGSDRRPNEFWGKMRLPVKGIPKEWSNVDKAMVWLNTHQLVYQNFATGNFTRAQLDHLKEAWKWVPDTTKLSRKPIKCYVYTVRGFDEALGKWAVMIDTNNNLDFSDETAFYPTTIDWEKPDCGRNP